MCECNLKHLFVGRDSLKRDRLKLHPDKSSKCTEEIRERFSEDGRGDLCGRRCFVAATAE